MGQREREVRRAAEALLEEVGVTAAPIDPVEIALAKGIRIEERRGFPPDVYGALYKDESGFRILISSDCHGPGHRAFTVGHELGHYHVDGHLDAMFEGGSGGQVASIGGYFRSQKDPHEREADWFASELLTPRSLVRPWVLDMRGSIADISLLANRFGVSLSCAGVRYAELTDEASAVVISRDGQVEWIAFSERIREHTWSRRAWRKELVPRGTATRRLSDGPDQVLARSTDSSESLLCEWFDGAPEEVTVVEECLGLGSYGRVMTVLSAPDLGSVDQVEEERHEGDWRERDWRDAIRGYELD